MMTNGGGLIPTIVDFDREAKYLISANPDNYDNWWSWEANALTCYLQSTDAGDADYADCFVILETNSRDEIAQAFAKNCNASLEYGYEKLKANEDCDGYRPDCNENWVNSPWAIDLREQGKHLMGFPGNLEDLVPLNEEAARILKQVARFHFEDHDPEYIRIMGHCAKFL